MTVELKKTNLPQLEKLLRLLKPLSISCGVVAIAGLAIYPLITNEPVEKVEEKVEKTTSALPPAPYTIIMGKKDNEVVLKFHNQNSELHLKNINAEEYNCLLNGGGVNCVLAEAYQPKSEVVNTKTKPKPTPKTEIKSRTLKIPEIEVSKNTMDNIMLIGGVGLGLLLISRFRK